MRDTQRRLYLLEQRNPAPKGTRIFQQDLYDAGLFFEGEQPYTQAQIDALGAAGWLCIVIGYEERTSG